MSSRLSIVHAPTGSDHPYQVVPEERTPRDPVGGDMVSIGFLTTPGGAAKGVRFYWERNGRPQTPVHGRPVSVGQDNDRWLVELGVLEAGDTVEYWMVADGGDATVESPRYRFATRRRRTLAGISALEEMPEGLLLSTLASDGNPGPTLALRLLEQAGGIQLELGMGKAEAFAERMLRPNDAPIILAAATVAAASLWFVAPVAAQSPKTDSVERLIPEQREAVRESEAERLELLFERLERAPDKTRAEAIAGNIRTIMLRSGSPTIDLLMVQASGAMRAKQLGTALDLLDAVTRLAPDYAEGWNMRATVHFMREDYGRSIADIEQVLRLEPRHWGALTGLALILVAIDEDEAALQAIDRALAVHPFLEQLKEQRTKLTAEVEGRAT